MNPIYRNLFHHNTVKKNIRRIVGRVETFWLDWLLLKYDTCWNGLEVEYHIIVCKSTILREETSNWERKIFSRPLRWWIAKYSVPVIPINPLWIKHLSGQLEGNKTPADSWKFVHCKKIEFQHFCYIFPFILFCEGVQSNRMKNEQGTTLN